MVEFVQRGWARYRATRSYGLPIRSEQTVSRRRSGWQHSQSAGRKAAAVERPHLAGSSPTILKVVLPQSAANMSLGSDTQLLASASPQGLRAGQLRRETPQNLRSLSALTTKCNVGTLLP